MRTFLNYTKATGEKIEIPLDEKDQRAIEYGAMKIETDNRGNECLVVTTQLNPEWEEGWQGEKHYVKIGDKTRVIPKWVTTKMEEFKQKEKQREANDKNFEGIIKTES